MIRFLPIAFLLSILPQLLPAQEDFKVIGYLPHYRFTYLNDIDFSKLTHLNIAFANPDMEGNLDLEGQNIVPVVQKAKNEGLIVLLSLAGGALLPEWEAAWDHLMQPGNRSAFIGQIAEYVNFHGMDGVDVDLEWSHVDYKYSPFVMELRDTMDAHGLLMTAALPGTYRYPDITDAVLEAYDWINMMAYDLAGPWDPNNPGPHSPYWFAVNSMNYWVGQGVPKEKLTLGVPFYGYDFGTAPVSSFTYRTMVSLNPDNAWVDQVGQAYYNGIPTIQAKTELAMAQLSGIMIWELGQDSYTELSLLKAIDEVVNPMVATHSEEVLDYLNVFPNPFSEQLSIENRRNEILDLQLTDLSGRIIQQLQIGASALQELNTVQLQPGFYLLRVLSEKGQQTFKLVKS